ncbi:serine hydrolase [Maribacter algarum]|uniref:Serine hydrolase n=1 Tax=Maribacter algarum (ex Zhang et al. 2020) TaxID=2578118 RepID=A0A5S3PNC6_9FLAO|nr:serine hydrolase [Maribacter algarum]TMM55978.1 serine hydrolase [Maribacter algarum]
MKAQIVFLAILFFSVFTSCSKDSNTENQIDEDQIEESDDVMETEEEEVAMYFPPVDSDTWEATTIEELEWNESAKQPLLDFLEENNTKSFMVLHEGKIVLEEYFDNHSATNPWYWASAGKTLTSTTVGIAQDQGLLNIDDKVSDYLGTGWTSAAADKEAIITNKHLLSMSSGLDDSLGDDVSPSNLQYVADAGTRWAYHNVYVKLQDVVAAASDSNWSDYFNTALRDKIGMTGTWIDSGEGLSVYWSNTRSMARFGLLVAANGKWEDNQIVTKTFLQEATETSQDINLSYGYMWWLNGKDSYGLPQTQLKFDGSLVADAPADMYSALGKNDQKIYIVPSEKLVVIRMGNAADDSNFALSSFDNALWEKITNLIQ